MQLGIFAACWMAVKLEFAEMRKNVGWGQIYGMAMLCGIGFTMSLFIGSLAFEAKGGSDYVVADRLGILVGSFLSATAGYLMLRHFCPAPVHEADRGREGDRDIPDLRNTQPAS